jgi:hypothetical protein
MTNAPLLATAGNAADPAGLLWATQYSLFGRVASQFCLNTVSEMTIEIPAAEAHVKSFIGEKIDWLARVDMRVPAAGFRTMRFTVTPRHSSLPHLTIEFGSVPVQSFFFYIDYVPRLDPLENPNYLYSNLYDWLDENRKQLTEEVGMTAFTSKERYIRAFMSPCACVFTCAASNENADLIAGLSQEALTLWLESLTSGQKLADTADSGLSSRDIILLSTAVKRDPGAVFAISLFGEEAVRLLQNASTPPTTL